MRFLSVFGAGSPKARLFSSLRHLLHACVPPRVPPSTPRALMNSLMCVGLLLSHLASLRAGVGAPLISTSQRKNRGSEKKGELCGLPARERGVERGSPQPRRGRLPPPLPPLRADQGRPGRQWLLRKRQGVCIESVLPGNWQRGHKKPRGLRSRLTDSYRAAGPGRGDPRPPLGSLQNSRAKGSVPDAGGQGQSRPGTGVDGRDRTGPGDPKPDPTVDGGLATEHGKERTEKELAACKEPRAEGTRGLRRSRGGRCRKQGGLGKAARCASPERAAWGERELPVTGGIRAERGRPVLGQEAAARLPARAGSPHV